MSLRVRSKLFLAAFAVGALSAVTAGVLQNSRLQRLTVDRIEQTLAAETLADTYRWLCDAGLVSRRQAGALSPST